MSYVFEGTFVLKLDAKGRMSLPAALRDGFAAGAVLTRHPDGCLMLYPEERWGA